jgi:hypothetical protein
MYPLSLALVAGYFLARQGVFAFNTNKVVARWVAFVIGTMYIINI